MSSAFRRITATPMLCRCELLLRLIYDDVAAPQYAVCAFAASMRVVRVLCCGVFSVCVIIRVRACGERVQTVQRAARCATAEKSRCLYC